jgi:hypothetical protein
MITERAMLAAVHISVWTAVKHDRKVSRDIANTDDPAKRTTIVDQIGETEGRLPSELLEGKTAIDLVSLTRLQADLGPQQVLVEYVWTILGPTLWVSLVQPSTDMYCRRSRPSNKRPAITDRLSRNESLTRQRDRKCSNSCLETYPHTSAMLSSFWCRMANCTCYPLAR